MSAPTKERFIADLPAERHGTISAYTNGKCRAGVAEARRNARAKEKAENPDRKQRREKRVTLSAEQMDALRAMVACLGCGAVPKPFGGKVITRHTRRCPVKRNLEHA